MIAGHTDQYQGDYVKALSRLLRKASDISQGDVEEVENLKGQYSDTCRSFVRHIKSNDKF